MLLEQQQKFLQRLLSSTFDFSAIEKQMEYLQNKQSGSMEFDDESMQQAMGIIKRRFEVEKKNTDIFKNQLAKLLQQNNQEKLLERINKGSD